MLSLEAPTTDSNDVNYLRSLLHARDAKIAFQQEMLDEKDSELSALRHDLDEIRSKHIEEMQMLQLKIQEMEQQNSMMEERLSAMYSDMNDEGGLEVFASLINELSSSKEKDECVRLLEAKLCKALHEREVWENQMAIIKNCCREAVECFEEENVLLSTQKFKLEVQLKNHLLAAETDKRSMEHEYEALLRGQRQTIEKLENDLAYVSKSCPSASSRSTSCTSLMTPSCSSRGSLAPRRSHSHNQLIITLPTSVEDDEATQESKVTLDMQIQSELGEQSVADESRPAKKPPVQRGRSLRDKLLFQKSKLHPDPSIEHTESADKKTGPDAVNESVNHESCEKDSVATQPRWQEIWEMDTACEILDCSRRRIGSSDTLCSVEANSSSMVEPIVETPVKKRANLLRCWSQVRNITMDKEVHSQEDAPTEIDDHADSESIRCSSC